MSTSPTHNEQPARRVVLSVQGMSCAGCAASVGQTLRTAAGVETAEVDLAGKAATVSGTDLDPAAMVQSLESLGFRARVI